MAMTDQRPLFSTVPLERNCEQCGAELRRGEGAKDLVCLGCKNADRSDRDYVLDLIELDQEFNPGEEITRERWNAIVRGSENSDREDAIRRAWERFKAWCVKRGAPVVAELDQAGTRKPLVLKRGIREWLLEAEERWVRPEPKTAWEEE